MLSSYSQAINKQNYTTGSLFQQKTKAKLLSEVNDGSIITYPDYAGIRNGTVCNKELLFMYRVD